MPQSKKITYTQSGVDYQSLDFLKRLAQKKSKDTAGNLPKKIREISKSRGESAYVVDIGDQYLAIVEEGLGTKNLIADEMYKMTGKTYYKNIAQDTVASIINDLITVGAKPVSVMAYWSTGNSDWFKDKKRMTDLVTGWDKACDLSGASWGGGETPTLQGIVENGKIELAGCAFGIINPKKRLCLGDNLKVGDRIILFESSGIHANGLTLARKIAKRLPEGYETKIRNKKMYGEAILEPTIIYAKLVQDIFESGVDIHYMSDITGHGWRKIMRHNNKFTYKISKLPPVPDVLNFIVKQSGLNEKEAYATFNMGAGFAVFVSQKDVASTLKMARKNKIKAYDVGVVEKGKKQVIIEPKNIVYEGNSLVVRG